MLHANFHNAKPLNVVITGATGLLGRAFISAISSQHHVSLVGRDRTKLQAQFTSNFHLMTWKELLDLNNSTLARADVVINLAGENIAAKRWHQAQKQKIIDSRVKYTAAIAQRCAKLDKPPRILNASAIGIYGFAPTINEQNHCTYDENSIINTSTTDFLSTVGRQWEDALQVAEEAGVKVVKMRFGVILSAQGGALAKMLPTFKLGLGAVLGSGQQPFSWVSIRDAVEAMRFLVVSPEINGPVNIVSPGIVSQQQFAQILAKSLNRTCRLKLPEAVVKLMFGQMGKELLLNGQKVQSHRLLANGFQFLDTDLATTLKDFFI